MVRCFTVASVKVRCFAVAIHQCQWFYGSLFQYSLSPHRPAKEIAIKAFACMPLLEARCFAGKKDVVNISFPQMITPCMFFCILLHAFSWLEFKVSVHCAHCFLADLWAYFGFRGIEWLLKQMINLKLAPTPSKSGTS